jgi:hypothetical protein
VFFLGLFVSFFAFQRGGKGGILFFLGCVGNPDMVIWTNLPNKNISFHAAIEVSKKEGKDTKVKIFKSYKYVDRLCSFAGVAFRGIERSMQKYSHSQLNTEIVRKIYWSTLSSHTANVSVLRRAATFIKVPRG